MVRDLTESDVSSRPQIRSPELLLLLPVLHNPFLRIGGLMYHTHFFISLPVKRTIIYGTIHLRLLWKMLFKFWLVHHH